MQVVQAVADHQRDGDKTMKFLARFLACCLTAAACSLAAAATPFPTRPVRIVVPYPPGGPFDGVFRALAQELGERWKQPVIIDNRPGANEGIGANIVAKSAADGYTLLASSEAGIMLNGLLFSKLPYNPDQDFAPVSRVLQVPMVLIVPTQFPASTLQEFIAVAKSRTDRPVNYGSSGVGGAGHLPLAMLAKENGLAMTHVPYKGAAPLVQDLMGGQVELGTLAASVVEPLIKTGKLKGLAVSADKRLPSLPQVPTFQETGLVDVHAEFMVGLVAPAGTPAPIVEQISGAIHEIIFKPEFRTKNLDAFSFTPIGSTPAEFKDYLVKDRPNQVERVRVSGAQLD
jgi:tripartite-type tricarboxylate transporter receptor subunit TctC